MRHGIELFGGFKSGQPVLITSERLRLCKMPGVVTGKIALDKTFKMLRVRVVAPWSVNVVFSVYVTPGELAESFDARQRV